MDALVDLSESVRTRLAEEWNVWLSTIRPDGSAHVTPVWFVYEDGAGDGGVWWIGSDAFAVKVRNVRAEPRVSLALENGTRPVVAEGTAAVADDDFPDAVVAAFAAKYDWDVTAPTRPGAGRVLLKVRVRRWLLAGTAQ